MNPPRKGKVVIPAITELEALADKIGSEQRTAKYRALVLISAWAGLRWGEATELRRGDFNADCSVVTISRAVTHHSGRCFVDVPKDGKHRTVVIPPHIRSEIVAHLAKYVDNGPDSLLFKPARGGCYVNDCVFSKDVFKPAAEAVGLQRKRAPSWGSHAWGGRFIPSEVGESRWLG